MRSSIIATAVAVAAVAVSQAEAARAPAKLSMETARAQTMQVIAKERQNAYGARELIGGNFTVRFEKCARPAQSRLVASCTYFIEGVDPVDPAASPLQYKKCAAGVSVRKESGGKRKVTRQRWAAKRCPLVER